AAGLECDAIHNEGLFLISKRLESSEHLTGFPAPEDCSAVAIVGRKHAPIGAEIGHAYCILVIGKSPNQFGGGGIPDEDIFVVARHYEMSCVAERECSIRADVFT